MKLSIAIPTYEGGDGAGVFHLEYQFSRFMGQTFTDFEVVISDHSELDSIKVLCEKYQKDLNIKYIKTDKDKGYWGSNLNNAIRNCSGDIVKTMLQDDFLFSDTSLKRIVDAFDIQETNWVVCGGLHTRDYVQYYNPVYPRYDPLVYRGINTIGGPSCLAVRKTEDMLFFEDKLNWMADCDYYKRAYESFGPPFVIPESLVAYKQWEGQMTNTLSAETKKREQLYLIEKFEAETTRK